MDGIYTDEHEKYQIDLRKTLWSTDALHKVYADIGNELSDVDWIAETENVSVLIEIKDATFLNQGNLNICTCEKPICKICNNPVKTKKVSNYAEFLNTACKKYYGGAFYLLSIGKIKPINYYYIVDNPTMDRRLRGKATASIKKRLPHSLQEKIPAVTKLLNEFEVISIEEWNEKYPMFPLAEMKKTSSNTISP